MGLTRKNYLQKVVEAAAAAEGNALRKSIGAREKNRRAMAEGLLEFAAARARRWTSSST